MPSALCGGGWCDSSGSAQQGSLLALPNIGTTCLVRAGRTDAQEVLHNQIDDLQTLLGSSFDHVGVGRDDGAQKGEYSPIFYDASQWVVLDWATKWLSKTPDVPGSKDWDAVSSSQPISGGPL